MITMRHFSFRLGVNESCAILEFNAAQNCSFVPTFGGNLSVLSSRLKQSEMNIIMKIMYCKNESAAR